ncbi:MULTISPECIES: sensor histidine kinase [Cyanophyceae]|uniref:sensor histidine kinase n=1 Tax=Cyanophyceae TaxID=3028117 RepID=UPI001685DAED|nr:histidine kinase dimerization/phospho-acceptor domain-containing protein [Nodosilinea sp. FACHB-131]
MALPPLDHVLSPVPAYGLTTPLGKIADDLGQLGAVTPSHIVVVNDEQQPLGAIAVGQLWAISQGTWLDRSRETATLQLADCQPWLEPVVEIMASEWGDRDTSTRLRSLALEATAAIWVGISTDGQYLGVLDSAKLMAWLAEPESEGVSETGDRPAAPLGLEPQAWVLELSHALKTPMTTLLGLSTLLLDSRVGLLSDRQFRYVSLMRQAIRKLMSLINLLLDWMRLESGQLSLSTQRVYLQPLANELLPSFFSAQSEGGGAVAAWADDFTVNLAIAKGWVQADPLRLRQSLHYGLGYLIAYGATPSGLVIEPWGPWLGITLWSSTFIVDPGPPLGTTVAPGLEIQLIPQSLEGLGLTLARRFTQLQGGELSGFSAPTWGSRITLLLPQTGVPHGGETTLILLASASQPVIDQVYGNLQGSPYRLAVALCCQTLAAMQTRLAPCCTLIHWEGLADAPIDTAAQMTLLQNLEIPGAVALRSSPEVFGIATSNATTPKTLYLETLAQRLRPTLDQICLGPSPSLPLPDGLTMLLLCPAGGDSALTPLVHTWLQRYHCRLLQVDDLQQASLLSRVWQPKAVILDGKVPVSTSYLQALARHPDLARLPLVALTSLPEWDAAALGLSLVLCPEVLTQPPAQAVVSLMRAIAHVHLAPEG